VLKPKRTFQTVVSELIEGLRTGAVKLQDEPEAVKPLPGVPVSPSLGGGPGASSGRPPAEQSVTAQGTGEE
jgi:hypothetical protein